MMRRLVWLVFLPARVLRFVGALALWAVLLVVLLAALGVVR